jgi:ribosomal protein S27E
MCSLNRLLNIIYKLIYMMMVNELTAYSQSVRSPRSSLNLIICPDCEVVYRELLHHNAFMMVNCNACNSKLGIMIYDDELYVTSELTKFACYGECSIEYNFPLPKRVPIRFFCELSELQYEVVLRDDSTIKYG